MEQQGIVLPWEANDEDLYRAVLALPMESQQALLRWMEGQHQYEDVRRLANLLRLWGLPGLLPPSQAGMNPWHVPPPPPAYPGVVTLIPVSQSWDQQGINIPPQYSDQQQVVTGQGTFFNPDAPAFVPTMIQTVPSGYTGPTLHTDTQAQGITRPIPCA